MHMPVSQNQSNRPFEPSRSNEVAFTICAINYLAQALALQASFRRHHPDSDFYIVVVDRRDAALEAAYPDTRMVWAEDLGIANFSAHALRFDVIELCTNVKPHSLGLLLEKYAKAVYLDPDTHLYSRLDVVFDALDTASIVVTPASMTPILDGHRPNDIEFLRVGAFNLGFIGVASGEEGKRFASWWSDRCLSDGFHETQSGLFVDQKWIDLAACYFPNFRILRDPGLNMAPWNIHERQLSVDEAGNYRVNREYTLKFFHFSSFDIQRPQIIAKRQTRYAEGQRADLRQILDDYAEALLKFDFQTLSKRPYSYDHTTRGEYISPTLRRLYANPAYGFSMTEDPSREDSELMRFARKRNLIGPQVTEAKRTTADDLSKHGRQIRIMAMLFHAALRLLGPNRYFALMRYLAFASSIRNQPKF